MIVHSIYAWISPKFRRRRMRWFRAVIQPGATERLLDLGGHPHFWAGSGLPTRITLLNVGFPPALPAGFPEFAFIAGDACALPFADHAFEIAFSNSVIEHVGPWERQQAFANEARRVARKLWVQTPAREFFIEPHLIAPFVHWLPRNLQRQLIRNCTLHGWLTRPGLAEVEKFLAEVRLLTRPEMERLFPDCEILTERFFGLPKSHIAVRRS